MKPTKTLSPLTRLTNMIVQEYHPEKIILFGSYARGEEKPESDIDVVVIKDTPTLFFARMREMAQILVKMPAQPPADVLVYTPHEFEALSARWNPFFQRILKEGKVVYAR